MENRMKILGLLSTVALGLLLGCTGGGDPEQSHTSGQRTNTALTVAWRYLIVSQEQMPGQDEPTGQESWGEWVEIEIEKGNAFKSDSPLKHGGAFVLSGAPRLENASQFVIEDLEWTMSPYDPMKWNSHFAEYVISPSVGPFHSPPSSRTIVRRSYELSPKLRETLGPSARQTSAMQHGRDGYRAGITIYLDIKIKESELSEDAEPSAG